MNIKHKAKIAIATLALGAFTVSATSADNAEKNKDAKSIVEIAVANDDFSTLVAALKAADLVDVLAGEGPFTVFAPTNAAFDKLPEGTLEELLKEENKESLVAVLLYHVVPGKAMAADVVGMDSATTVQGSDVTIAVDGETVTVDEATVVAVDIEASNGVIHVIDTVIVPKD